MWRFQCPLRSVGLFCRNMSNHRSLGMSAGMFPPQLARYLNRTYWEKKQEEVRKSPTPSAPAPAPLAEPLPISQPMESHIPVQPISIVEVRHAPSDPHAVWRSLTSPRVPG